ncbi:hypothetical protein GCM10022220_31620 [Actinocatenispora rupis]
MGRGRDMLTSLLNRFASKSRYVGRHRAGSTESGGTTTTDAESAES